MVTQPFENHRTSSLGNGWMDIFHGFFMKLALIK